MSLNVRSKPKPQSRDAIRQLRVCGVLFITDASGVRPDTAVGGGCRKRVRVGEQGLVDGALERPPIP